MRLGILGGTFDPIHLGHLRLAEEAGETFDLEKVYLIPAAFPPHKGKQTMGSFFHRFEMTKLAVAGSSRLVALDLEARREGLSYSIETLKEFHRLYPRDLELFFILGTDAFLEIETWKSYRNLFDYAHFLVVQRPGIPARKVQGHLLSLGLAFKKEGRNRFLGTSGNEVVFMKATLMDISSTAIREKAAASRSIRYLVPASVRNYILVHGLYQTHASS